MSAQDNTNIVNFSTGERIISQGEQSNKAYMVVSGEVRVFLEEDGKNVTLATLGEDEIFGESAILSDECYGAHVEALEDVTLKIITKEALGDMLTNSDPFLGALMQTMVKRLMVTNEALLKSETREFMDIALV